MPLDSMTFYWHDYETFGTDPRRDRAAQFAGLRTDSDLNVIGEPLVQYCKPANDYLPHPEACLVTGITPQTALQEGVNEAEFIRRIHAELSQPGTCGVGYNSIRFDDEVTRHLLYRNFYDPYAREWQNGNSRWDLIDMMRLTWALRPQGIEWPQQADGTPSFRLDQLTVANGIAHDNAHDALADVYATIEIARLIRTRQPKLFDYVFQHRDKRVLEASLNIKTRAPVVHVSGQYPASQGCLALVVPLAQHPRYKNEMIVYNLAADPEPLLSLDAETIRERVFTAKADLPTGVERIPLKTIHLNKCPILAPRSVLRPADAERLGMDLQQCQKHLEQIQAAPFELGLKLQNVWEQSPAFVASTDPDLMLYNGFFSRSDKALMTRIQNTPATELGQIDWRFQDARLPELLFRYRARNFPESLNQAEARRWEQDRLQRLNEAPDDNARSVAQFRQTIEGLLSDSACSQDQRTILLTLQTYADEIVSPAANLKA